MNRIKLSMNTLFSGIGCQEQGIKNTGLFDLEVRAISEINKEALLAYATIHYDLTTAAIHNYNSYPSENEMRDNLIKLNIGWAPEKNQAYNWSKVKGDKLKGYWLANKLSHNLGDIKNIEQLPYADLWSISSPCTDISVSGKLRGLNPDDETRSSLIWQNIRLLKKAQETKTLPKFLFLENVKNLVSKRFKKDFDIFNELIESFGYNNYWKVLNAKECGIPQNRERVFAIYIRKDIDNGLFEFPKPFDSGVRLKDVFDPVEEISESYYIKNEKTETLIKTLLDKNVINSDSPIVRDNTTNKEARLGNIYGEQFTGGNFAGNVYDSNYISRTLTCMGNGGGRMPMIIEQICVASRGREKEDKWTQQFEPNLNEITNAITDVSKDNLILEISKEEK